MENIIYKHLPPAVNVLFDEDLCNRVWKVVVMSEEWCEIQEAAAVRSPERGKGRDGNFSESGASTHHHSISILFF